MYRAPHPPHNGVNPMIEETRFALFMSAALLLALTPGFVS
jgi:hypothetical protein